jgi:hypothetical protein
MHIDDVSDRMVANEIADKYGLLLDFVRDAKACLYCRVLVRRAISIDCFDGLTSNQFNSMTFADLKSMCVYWQMVGIFSHE